MNNYLNLRIVNSPYGDVTKGSVLSQSELDNNFIFLKGNVIYTALTDNGIVTLKKYNGDDIIFSGGTTGSSTFTGGTVNGATIFTGGLTANTISANTLTLNDVTITAFTSGTPFYLFDSTTDAGSDKTSIIQRKGGIFIGDYVASSATGNFNYLSESSVNISNNGFTSFALNTFTNINGLSPSIRIYRQRGTDISPLNLLKNDKIGDLQFITNGYGTSGSTQVENYIGVYADENHSGTTYGSAMGTRMEFYLTPNGTTLSTKALTIIGSGDTRIFGNLTASTISATTYYNLPNDVFTTGGTYSDGTTTFTNNTGGTFNVTGYFKTSDDIYTTGMTFNPSNYNLTISRNDNTNLTQSLALLATDMNVTGGTYNPNSGVATFTNNSGGTFNVSGFLTGQTDTYVTGLTFNNNTLTLKQTNNQADLSVLFNTVTGLTSTGTISSSILSATTYQNLPVDVFTTGFTYNNANTLTIVNNTGGTLTTSLNILTGLTVSGLVSATTISGNTIYANDFPQLPYTDGQTIDYYEVGSTTYIRIKDSVAAPSGGTRSFIGNVNITSGLTINGNLTFTGQSNNPIYSAGTVTSTHIPNWDNSNIQTVILSAATTNISGGTNIANGAVYTIILKQNVSGSRTVNWGSEYKWQSGIAPILTATANAVDILTFISDGTNLYGLIAKDFR